MSSIKRFVDLISRKRVLISRIIFVAIAAEFIINHWHSFLNPESIGGAYLAGTFLIVLGALIRSWAAGILRKVRRLVQEGPYALARNPLYIGSFLIACGFGFYLADIWFWIGMLAVFIFIYPGTIRHEEEVLKYHFPEDWASYSQSVGMFWPIHIDWKKVAYPWSGQLWIKNSEHQTLILILLGLAAKLLKIVLL